MSELLTTFIVTDVEHAISGDPVSRERLVDIFGQGLTRCREWGQYEAIRIGGFDDGHIQGKPKSYGRSDRREWVIHGRNYTADGDLLRDVSELPTDVLQSNWNWSDQLVRLAFGYGVDDAVVPSAYLLPGENPVVFSDRVSRDVFGDPVWSPPDSERTTASTFFPDEEPRFARRLASDPVVARDHANYTMRYIQRLAEHRNRCVVQFLLRR